MFHGAYVFNGKLYLFGLLVGLLAELFVARQYYEENTKNSTSLKIVFPIQLYHIFLYYKKYIYVIYHYPVLQRNYEAIGLSYVWTTSSHLNGQFFFVIKE